MKKITTISSIFALMTVPAVAAPTHTSATFPQSGVMEEDYQYTGQANVTNLKVASGTANTLAGYTDCPSGYPNSDAGATSTDECYKACTVADLPANSHAATASGKNYSGANVTDTCEIATCETGYTFNAGNGNPDLMTLIGTSEAGTRSGYKSNDGTRTESTDMYGITQNGEFVVDYGNKGKIHGFARCSSQSGSLGTISNGTYPDITTMPILPDSSGGYCWCQIDSYTPYGGSSQSVSAPWVIQSEADETYNNCASYCATNCSEDLEFDFVTALAFRSAVFNAAAPSAPLCKANTYTVYLNPDVGNEGTPEVSAEYNSNMPTPITLPTRAGYVFAGFYDTDAATGGTQYYTATGESSHVWDKTTNNIELYARWTRCAAGSYCPGDNTTNTCPNGYVNSDAGSNDINDCYRACSTSLFANSASVSGKEYYGNGGLLCTIDSCNTGYTPNTQSGLNLTTLIGLNTVGTGVGVVDPSGIVFGGGDAATYGLSSDDVNTFVVDYGTYGKIRGRVKQTTQSGTGLRSNPAATTASEISFTETLPDTIGEYCWVRLESYTPNNGVTQWVTTPWVFHDGNCGTGTMKGDMASDDIASMLQNPIGDNVMLREALFSHGTTGAPSCDANVITINWDHADSADITANDAGSVTYGGNINTPKKAQHINGKIFTGWTFVTPQQ